jgi:hypothetical protein
VRSPLAGLLRTLVALAIAGALIGVPAVTHAAPGTAVPVAPIGGETVVGDPVLTWTEALGTGYEVRWNADGSLGVDGALDPATGGRAFPGVTSHRITDLTAPIYHWQVRALPNGEWSPIATFSVDIQLDTLGPGTPAEEVDEPVEPEVEPAPEAGRQDAVGGVSGFVWIAAASTLAGLILAVVGREWLRLRRQEP